MAQQFVGMTVALTLSNNTQLKGTVSKVDSTTQILHLHDGTPSLEVAIHANATFLCSGADDGCIVSFLPDGGKIPNYSIEASHIMSLEIVPMGRPLHQPTKSPIVQEPPPQPAAEFNDPAILSVLQSHTGTN